MRSTLVLLVLPVVLASCASLGPQPESLEESVCGTLKEPLVFWLWSRSAGKSNPLLAQKIKNAEALAYETSDGRILRGYKLKAMPKDGVVRGSVLLAQGNAMLAEQLLWSMVGLSEAGMDVYVFDYRGYGQSNGKSRLKAIVSDYREIFENLIPKKEGKRFLYGISFGGVIVANVIGSGVEFDGAVIDSSPSRLSDHGCEAKYDAVANVPQNASRMLVVTGGADRIVKPKDSQDLRAMIEQRGGKSVVRPDFAHPFMDSSIEKHQERMALIRQYLVELETR